MTNPMQRVQGTSSAFAFHRVCPGYLLTRASIGAIPGRSSVGRPSVSLDLLSALVNDTKIGADGS
jgi:hypothetical protein